MVSPKTETSDVAKLWTASYDDSMQVQETSLPDYHKYLRGEFAKYSHCSYDLCLWDLFFDPKSKDENTGAVQGTLELNFTPLVINSNAHAIDAYLTAHLLEFIELIKLAYKEVLHIDHKWLEQINVLEKEIQEIMEKHNQHRCQEVRIPPEVARLQS